MTNEHNNAAKTDWRELCRRLYVELWHCDKQMTSGARPKWKQGPAVRDVLRDANLALEATPAAAPAPASSQDEPFGYFRAEPFGWTDCAATDEGAIALYERPAAPAVPQGFTFEQLADACAEAGVSDSKFEAIVLSLKAATPAAPSQEPAVNLSCKSTQARLAAQWGYVPAPSQPVTLTDEEIDKAILEPLNALLDHIYEHTTLSEGILPIARKIANAIIAALQSSADVRDAERYRWLRRRACVIGKTTYCGEETGLPILDFVNLPDVTEVISRDSATTLDAAIDAALREKEGA